MSPREQYVTKLNAARQELKTAGIFHRRDLTKHIRRMERELRDYDRYHEGGDSNGKPAEPKDSKPEGSPRTGAQGWQGVRSKTSGTQDLPRGAVAAPQ